jgi:hypothetical protein
VNGRKAKHGFMQRADGTSQRVIVHEDLLGEKIPGGAYIDPPAFVDANGNTLSAMGGMGGSGGSSGGGGSSGFGSSMAKVDRFNPVYDDLSKGTVAEDWIPRDPRLQNRMFRMMFHRGAIEGPVVETIAELCWSNFDIMGIRDKVILDTYEAAKEAVRVDRYLEDITKEYLVIGRAIVQLILNADVGIWTDMLIHNSDYVQVGEIPRTGYMPKLDLLPSPQIQAWVKSQDPRDIEAKKGLPKELLQQFSQNRPIPLDPTVTAYLPRRSFFDDVFGTSFYVRNIPLWGLEKSLINATLTGHRRRSGPITQIAVGSEQWEPTPEQIDALVSAYTTAEEDSVSSTIGTRYDVAFNNIRGGLQEMWKWTDEWAFLQEAKLKMFGVSEALITGEANIDTTIQPTIFLERLKAHRKYVVETFLMQKFFRALAQVHQFRKVTEAELSHRIRVDNDDHELILPTLVFHRNLDVAADTARADLLEKMEEKGLPVGKAEWNRALGGGELQDRMRNAVEDLEFQLKYAKYLSVQEKVTGLVESAGSQENLDAQIAVLSKEVESLKLFKDETPYEVADLSKKGKKRAEEVADGTLSSSSVIAPASTKVLDSDPVNDLSRDHAQLNRDRETLSGLGKAL